MIRIETLKGFTDNSNEGKLLLAALAILTSMTPEEVGPKWGGSIHPDDALKRVVDLANKIYFEEEYKAEEKLKGRDQKITQILKDQK
jgi:tRNA G26 N,N-dimethylase Trm1